MLAKVTKVFLAGAKELKKERQICRDVLMSYQSNLDILVEIKSFENFSASLSSDGRQVDYNKYIAKEADMTIFLIDARVGKITLEEFEIAFNAYKKRKCPKILVFVKKQETTDDLNIVTRKLIEIKQYYIEYNNDTELEEFLKEETKKFFYNRQKKRNVLLISVLCILIVTLLAGAGLFLQQMILNNIYKGRIDGNKNPSSIVNPREFKNELRIKVKGYPIEFVYIAGGTFLMGATSEQQNASADEMPVKVVTLPSYYISKYEITQELWQLIMHNNPSKGPKEKRKPVQNVTWIDCQKFIYELTEITQGRYMFKLPTEEQWEYAARGGQKSKGYLYSGSNNVYEVVALDTFNAIKDKHVHVVGLKKYKPNELGIYDMSGNVCEWCNDFYRNYDDSSVIVTYNQLDNKIVRGGYAYCKNFNSFRVSYRNSCKPYLKTEHIGFRLVYEP